MAIMYPGRHAPGLPQLTHVRSSVGGRSESGRDGQETEHKLHMERLTPAGLGLASVLALQQCWAASVSNHISKQLQATTANAQKVAACICNGMVLENLPCIQYTL